MNEFVHRRFSPECTDYDEVIALHESGSQTLSSLQLLCPSLPKGWFELAQLSFEDRIEFISLTWKKALSMLPHMEDFITAFFGEMEDIGIYLCKREGEWEARMVYSMGDGENYFQGRPPASDVEIAKVSELLDFPFPEDYIAFLKIHNGFARDTDIGVFPVQMMRSERQVLQVGIRDEELHLLYRGDAVDTEALFPFYRSRDLRIYQCFFTKWLVGDVPGNVYCSLSEGYLSDFQNGEESLETLAFPTFLDWISFYVISMED